MKSESGVAVLAVIFIGMFLALSGYITGHAVGHQSRPCTHESQTG